MANEEYVNILTSGSIEAWNRRLEDDPGIVLDLSLADLSGATLCGADLRGAYLTSANCTGVNLTGANLRGANLTDVNLTDANLTNADLTDANLTDANLTDVNLTGVSLANAILKEANFTRANLRSADLSGADFFDASLFAANITNTRIWQVKRLTQEQLNAAVFNPTNPPILPEGFVLPKNTNAVGQGAGLDDAGQNKANANTKIEKELRSDERKHMIKSGEIWFNDGNSSMSCQVRDLTPMGARIKFRAEFVCPKHVKLQMPGGELHGPLVRAERIWVRQREVGLRFTDGDSFQ